MTIDDKIKMARQMLWNRANSDDAKLGEMIEVHQWLMALEAAKDCAPVDVSTMIS